MCVWTTVGVGVWTTVDVGVWTTVGVGVWTTVGVGVWTTVVPMWTIDCTPVMVDWALKINYLPFPKYLEQ